MAICYLDKDDQIEIFGPSRIYGNSGTERVFLKNSAKDVEISSTVEEVHISLKSSECQFRGVSGKVEILKDGEIMASVVTNFNNSINFLDGAAYIDINTENGALSLGGVLLGINPEQSEMSLDSSKPAFYNIKQDNPNTPDVPSQPEQPDVPDTPEYPDFPDTPTNPDMPDNPSQPSYPDTPSIPSAPDMPGYSGQAMVLPTASVIDHGEGFRKYDVIEEIPIYKIVSGVHGNNSIFNYADIEFNMSGIIFTDNSTEDDDMMDFIFNNTTSCPELIENIELVRVSMEDVDFYTSTVKNAKEIIATYNPIGHKTIERLIVDSDISNVSLNVSIDEIHLPFPSSSYEIIRKHYLFGEDGSYIILHMKTTAYFSDGYTYSPGENSNGVNKIYEQEFQNNMYSENMNTCTIGVQEMNDGELDGC